jgi:hypothetical protein
MKMCEGLFGSEAVAILGDGYAKYGKSASETFNSYPCVVRGRAGHCAQNNEGQWLPESHDPPTRKLVNPSDKSRQYKR